MKLLKTIALILITPLLLFAEGGSVYTRYGLGDLSFAGSARRMGLNGLGIAAFDREDIGSLNPAAWSGINLTRFNIGLNYNGYGLKDNNTSAFYSGVQFAGFTLAIPIEKSLGMTVVLGIVPYSNIEYDVTEEQPHEQFPNSMYFEGEGGISRSFLGLSYKLPLDFNVGASIDYYIGNIDYVSGIEFSGSSTSIMNSEFRKTLKLSGLGGNFGLISGDLFRFIKSGTDNQLRLAFTYMFSQEFDADTSLNVSTYTNTRELQSNVVTSDLATGKANVDIPARIGVGLSFLYNQKYNLLVDYIYQPWSEYKFTKKTFGNLRNLQKIGIGLEYKNPDTRTGGFWEHIDLRAGVSYEESQYAIKGTKINQMGISGGFSVPLDYANTIDFAVEYAQRGSNDLNLIKENLIKFNVTLNLGELWFFRQ